MSKFTNDEELEEVLELVDKENYELYLILKKSLVEAHKTGNYSGYLLPDLWTMNNLKINQKKTLFDWSLKKKTFIYCCVCDTASTVKDLYQHN